MDQPDDGDELILQAGTDGELAQGEAGVFEGLQDAEGLVQTEHEPEWHGVVGFVASIVRGHGRQPRNAR